MKENIKHNKSYHEDLVAQNHSYDIELSRGMSVVAKNPIWLLWNNAQKDGDNWCALPTANAYKLFFIVLSRIKPNDDKVKTMRLTVKGYCEMIGIDYTCESAYRTTRNAISALCSLFVWLPSDDDRYEEETQHYLTAKKVKGQRAWDLTIGSRFEPFLIGITGKDHSYTKFILHYILPMSSSHSIRLYLALKTMEYAGPNLKFTIPEIRRILGILPHQYSEFYLLKRVIDKAIEEINLYTDLQVSYDIERKGFVPTGIILKVYNISHNSALSIQRDENRAIALTPKSKNTKKRLSEPNNTES